MKKIMLAALVLGLGLSTASAQSAMDPNMTCADYLKALAQMGNVPKSGDAAVDAMDKKINDYCKANPAAKLSVAMEKAMQ